MLNRYVFGTAIAIVLISACSSEQGNEFNFTKGDPFTYLTFLERKSNVYSFYTVTEPIPNWVKEEHIPGLIKLLSSKQPCMAVGLSASSKIRRGSTIGDEAAFLIMGFRTGEYPASLNSEPLDQARMAEILKWWNAYPASLHE